MTTAEPQEVLYSLSQYRFFEILCGMRAGREGAPPNIYIKAHPLVALGTTQTGLDMAKDPEEVRVLHDREHNTLFVEAGPHLRGQPDNMAAADRAFDPSAFTRKARKKLRKIELKLGPATGRPS